MKKQSRWSAVLLLLVLLTIAPLQAFAEETNRNEVRARLAEGGWSVVYGDLINEADMAKFGVAVAGAVAAENPAPIYKFFDDQLQQQINKIMKTAPEIGLQAVTDLLLRAFNGKGQVLRQGRLEVSAGMATYKRWEKIIYDEPRSTKCKQKLPFGGWTWVPCMKMERVERTVPWPNNHQPYFRFRWASAANSSVSTSAAGSGQRYGLLCLMNRTGWNISYSYRWGDGEWKTARVDAGGSRSHWWNYASGSTSSPDFAIRFDADFTSGSNYKQYNLKRFAANDTNCQSGKVYEFEKLAGEAVELYASKN